MVLSKNWHFGAHLAVKNTSRLAFSLFILGSYPQKPQDVDARHIGPKTTTPLNVTQGHVFRGH